MGLVVAPTLPGEPCVPRPWALEPCLTGWANQAEVLGLWVLVVLAETLGALLNQLSSGSLNSAPSFLPV